MDIGEDLRQRVALNVSAMRTDGANGWPDCLLDDVADAPLVSEADVETSALGVFRGEPTEAELMVLRCLSRGLSIPESAVALGKGYQTIKTQARTARARMGAKTLTQATCEAIRRGLIP